MSIPQDVRRVLFTVDVGNESTESFRIEVSNYAQNANGPITDAVNDALDDAVDALLASLETSYPLEQVSILRQYTIIPEHEQHPWNL